MWAWWLLPLACSGLARPGEAPLILLQGSPTQDAPFTSRILSRKFSLVTRVSLMRLARFPWPRKDDTHRSVTAFFSRFPWPRKDDTHRSVTGFLFPEQPFVMRHWSRTEDAWKQISCQTIAEPGFNPGTFGLWAQHANHCATPLVVSAWWWFLKHIQKQQEKNGDMSRKKCSGLGPPAPICLTCRNDSGGVRTHTLTEWRLEPPP